LLSDCYGINLPLLCIVAHLIEKLQNEVLLDLRETIWKLTDSKCLIYLLDQLTEACAIHRDQAQLIKRKTLHSSRMNLLLKVLSSEGQSAFDIFCNALDTFATRSSKTLADKLRQSLKDKQYNAIEKTSEY